MNDKKLRNLGRLGLFSAAFFWGVAFVVMKNLLTNIPTLYILTARFCGSALILLPVCAGKLKKIDKKYLIGGSLMGITLMLAYAFQTYGLNLTTPGKNAFLTCVYCVIVPFLFWGFTKNKPDKFNVAAAVICIVGIGFISLDNNLSIASGDFLTIICGFFFALNIVVTARAVPDRDPVVLVMIQFASAGVVSIICAAIVEPFPKTIAAADIWGLIFLTVVCTAGCLFLQVFGQKYTPPSETAVIISMESPFGALASVLLYGEILTFKLIVGFILTFAAVIISETKLKFRQKRKT